MNIKKTIEAALKNWLDPVINELSFEEENDRSK